MAPDRGSQDSRNGEEEEGSDDEFFDAASSASHSPPKLISPPSQKTPAWIASSSLSARPGGQPTPSSSSAFPKASFPPLGVRGPSKSAQRRRHLFQHSSQIPRTFDSYPPRAEELVERERRRLQEEHAAGSESAQVHSREHGDEEIEGSDEEWRRDKEVEGVSGSEQKTGMSSVVIYDEATKKVLNMAMPDIYRRGGRQTDRDNSRRSTKARDAEALHEPRNADKDDIEEKAGTEKERARRPLPDLLEEPLTMERLDQLIAACERQARIRALDSRLGNINLDSTDTCLESDNAADDKLILELRRAFCSPQHLKAAFGLNNEANSQQEQDLADPR